MAGLHHPCVHKGSKTAAPSLFPSGRSPSPGVAGPATVPGRERAVERSRRLSNSQLPPATHSCLVPYPDWIHFARGRMSYTI